MNDIDIQMNEAINTANGLANARKHGICAHGWRQGKGNNVKCLDCGKIASEEELNEERREVLIEWT